MTDRIIDLDAAKEARAAQLGEPPMLRWRGVDYVMPSELPARFLDRIVVDDFEGAFGALFGDDGFDVVVFLESASYDDLRAMSEGVARVYGIEGGLGNSRASGVSSPNTSKR